MRRWILVLALAGACGGKKKAPSARDVEDLSAELEVADLAPDPIAAVIAAVQNDCAKACPPPTLEDAATYLAKRLEAKPPGHEALAAAMDELVLWRAPGWDGLPEAKHVQPSRAWAVITVDADGALTVALANRMRLTASGLKVERSHVQAVLTAEAAEKVLDEIDPFAVDDEAPPPPESDDLDPQLARAQAIQAAREVGILGGDDDRPNEYTPCVVEHRDLGSRPESEPVRVVAWLGPVGGRPLIMADAAAPSATVLGLLDTVDGGALAVRAGGGTSALAFAICDDVLAPDLPVLKLEKGGTIPAGSGQVDLLVSDKLSYGELVAALDAAIDGGATLMLLHGAATGADGMIIDVPQIRIGMPTVTGGLDRVVVRRALARAQASLLACYTTPGKSGTVMLHIAADAQGHVTDASSEGFEPAVASCLVTVAKTLQFPGAAQVEAPIAFRPSGG